MRGRLCPTCQRRKHTTLFQFAHESAQSKDCRKCYRKKAKMGGVDIDRIHYIRGALTMKKAA